MIEHTRPMTRGKRRIRVLLADDHAILRDALHRLLDAYEEIDVVADVEHGREAVRVTERLLPDVVLMDLVMPGLSGLEATRQIRKRVPGVRVLILTAYAEEEQIIDALRAGASGFVVKNSAIEELLLAIRVVHRGNKYFSSQISDVVDVHKDHWLIKLDHAKAGYELLTEREREVLQLIAEGYQNQQIAKELVISVKTVEAHKDHIMRKVGARNRTDLIRYALRKGLVGLDPEPSTDFAKTNAS